MKLLFSIFRCIFRGIFKLFYRHRTYGIENIPHGGAIIAPNHISYLDPPLVAASSPEDVHFLARDTLFKQPLLGSIIRRLNAFPVSGNPRDIKSIKAISQLLAEGNKVIIFPEGIRTHDGKLTHVKPGIAMLAIRANVPIIPTFIHGTFEIWPRNQWFPKPWGKTLCSFGQPIYPDQYRHLQKKEQQIAIANDVKDRIETLRSQYS